MLMRARKHLLFLFRTHFKVGSLRSYNTGQAEHSNGVREAHFCLFGWKIGRITREYRTDFIEESDREGVRREELAQEPTFRSVI